MAASKFAKVKTITQIVAITAVMLDNYPFSLVGFPFKDIALLVAVVFTVVSGFDYFAAAGDLLGERQPQEVS